MIATPKNLTIQQAADATGWSQRMLRYLEHAGLVAALRTQGGHRSYGPRQIERLQQLRELIDEHQLGITDIAFELRMRTDADLNRAVDDWFGAVHRVAPPPQASFYRRLAVEDSAAATQQSVHQVHNPPHHERGDTVSPTMTADSAGTVSDFKVADL